MKRGGARGRQNGERGRGREGVSEGDKQWGKGEQSSREAGEGGRGGESIQREAGGRSGERRRRPPAPPSPARWRTASACAPVPPVAERGARRPPRRSESADPSQYIRVSKSGFVAHPSQ